MIRLRLLYRVLLSGSDQLAWNLANLVRARCTAQSRGWCHSINRQQKQYTSSTTIRTLILASIPVVQADAKVTTTAQWTALDTRQRHPAAIKVSCFVALVTSTAAGPRSAFADHAEQRLLLGLLAREFIHTRCSWQDPAWDQRLHHGAGSTGPT